MTQAEEAEAPAAVLPPVPSGTTAKPRSGTTAAATATSTAQPGMLSGSNGICPVSATYYRWRSAIIFEREPPVLPPDAAVLPPPYQVRYYRQHPAVLPLPACSERAEALVSLSHLPLWVKPIYRHLPPPDLDRLCFEIRVEVGSPPQDGLLPPLAGMVPPLVEKIPSWIQDLYL